MTSLEYSFDYEGKLPIQLDEDTILANANTELQTYLNTLPPHIREKEEDFIRCGDNLARTQKASINISVRIDETFYTVHLTLVTSLLIAGLEEMLHLRRLTNESTSLLLKPLDQDRTLLVFMRCLHS